VAQLQGKQGRHLLATTVAAVGFPVVRDRGGALERLCEGKNQFEVMGGEELTGGGGSTAALLGR
jgi:hypothetical protein